MKKFNEKYNCIFWNLYLTIKYTTKENITKTN